MSEVVQGKSVIIEGDKSYFFSKGAVDRLKRDLKNDDKEKLFVNDYFKEGWTYQLLSNVNNEIKIKILNKLDVPVENTPAPPRVLEADERRQMLKNKLREMRGQKVSSHTIKSKLKEVPKDLADAYLNLKKFKLPVSIHDPADVLAKKDEYRNVIHTMIQSFGAYKGPNNPVINYYKLLGKYLDILPEVPHKHSANCSHNNPQSNVPSVKDFLEELKNKEVDKEMTSIYNTIGLNEEKNKNEMNNIYNSIGINKEETNYDTDQLDDDDLKNILDRLGLSKEMTV